MQDPFFFEERELPGRARLFHQRRDMSWCGMGVVIHAGHMHDPVGKEGTAHLLEHHVSNGRIGDLPAMSSADLRAWLVGNRMTASLGTTALYWTRYGGRAENANVGLLARFLTDLVFRPGLDGDLEHEREIVRAERVHRARDRGGRIAEMVASSAYGEHRRLTATGLPEDEVLDAITREDVAAFHAHHYAPANVRIISIGGVSANEMRETLERLIPAQREGQASVRLPTPLPLRVPDPREIYVSREDGRPAESLSLRWKWRMPVARDRIGAVTAWTLKTLLHDRVREGGRAVYGIEASSGFDYDHSWFAISTKVDADKAGRVREEVAMALRDEAAITAAFRRKANDPTLEEIFFDRTCAEILEHAFVQVAAYGRVATHAELCATVRAVTEADVLEYVRTTLAQDRAQLVIIERQ